MKKIVVATDFSHAAANAVRYAAQMAMSLRAELLLLHVFESAAGYNATDLPHSLKPLYEKAKALLEQLRHDLEQQTDHQVSISSRVAVGQVYPELESVCARLQPCLVVIGSTGKNTLERLLFGTHAVHILERLTWPVVAVPRPSAFSGFHKIGFACNLKSFPAGVPLNEIARLLGYFQAQLHVLHIGSGYLNDPVIKVAAQSIGDTLKPAAIYYHFVDSSDTGKAMLDLAEGAGLDLLIVLPERKGLPEAWLNKRLARQFVRHSHLPVMSLPIPAAANGRPDTMERRLPADAMKSSVAGTGGIQ